MDNPLQRFVPVEERKDGVYISVTREASSSLKIEEMADALQSAFVINANVERIEEIIRHGRVAFEKIGPPFEYYNPELEKYVEVGGSPMRAVIKVNSLCIANGVIPSVASLLFCLKRKGIIVGLKQEVVSSLFHNALFDKELVIAEGKEPVRGKDASIAMEVNILHDFKPQEKRNGSVDYRNVNTITKVVSGQVIARKIPPTNGEPGRTVRGEEVSPEAGKDMRFPGGKNTRVSEDGLCLLAVKSGFIYKDGDLIQVSDLLPIPKDVDFSVGNIKYSGDVHIMGNVLPGFTVETEGNIIINGQIESARIISRDGCVEIHKGVIGKGETYISGKKKIQIEFVQDAVLVSEGSIAISKFCLHCESVSNAFEAKEAHSSVIGGHIKAYTSIELFQAGNEKGVPTKLSLVDKNEQQNKEKLKELEILRKKLSDEFESVKKQLKTKAVLLKKTGNTTDRVTDELKKWLNMYKDLSLKMQFVEKNILSIQEKLKNPVIGDGSIKIFGSVFPGTELEFYGVTKSIKSIMTNKIFRFKDGSIAVEG